MDYQFSQLTFAHLILTAEPRLADTACDAMVVADISRVDQVSLGGWSWGLLPE